MYQLKKNLDQSPSPIFLDVLGSKTACQAQEIDTLRKIRLGSWLGLRPSYIAHRYRPMSEHSN